MTALETFTHCVSVPVHCNHNNIIIGDVIRMYDASRPLEGRSKIVATVKRYNEVHIKLHTHQREAGQTYTVVVYDRESNKTWSYVDAE